MAYGASNKEVARSTADAPNVRRDAVSDGRNVGDSRRPRLAFVLSGLALIALGVALLASALPPLVGSNPSAFHDGLSWTLWFVVIAWAVAGASSVVAGLLVLVAGSKRFWPSGRAS